MSGQDILRNKEKSGNNTNKGTQSYSRLTRVHKSHVTEFHETLRQWNLESVDFGSKFHVQLNSSNLIQDMCLVLELKESQGNYAEAFGSVAVRDIKFRFNGREITRYLYKNPLFIMLQKLEKDVDRAELHKITGGAKGGSARSVIVPIFAWWDSLTEGTDIKHRRPWKNAFSGKLQIEIQMQEKQKVTDNHVDCQILSAKFVHSEILVPARLESALSRPVREAPRITYNQLENISFSSGVKKEVQIDAMSAGGNIRNCFMYFRVATTGADTLFPDDDCLMPTAVALKINGVIVIEEEQPVMDWSQWTRGIHPRPGRAYCLSFAETPLDSSSSGYLPAGTDSTSLELTVGADCVCDLYFEYEKLVKVDNLGRYTQSDQ